MSYFKFKPLPIPIAIGIGRVTLQSATMKIIRHYFIPTT